MVAGAGAARNLGLRGCGGESGRDSSAIRPRGVLGERGLAGHRFAIIRGSSWGRIGPSRIRAMRFGRKKRQQRGPSEAPAARIGLKPPGGGKLKWIRVGFAWDLFVLSPLLGVPLFLRKLHQWGAAMLALLLLWVVLGSLLGGQAKNLAGVAVAVVSFLIQLFLGLYGNRLTARAYLRHGWTIDHPDYAATRKVMKRWKLED